MYESGSHTIPLEGRDRIPRLERSGCASLPPGERASVELASGAVRAVGDRLGLLVVGQVHTPPFRRDIPRLGAFDALDYLGALRGN
jgi:hypothetical protein